MKTMMARGIKNKSTGDAGTISFYSQKSCPSSLVSYDSEQCQSGLKATLRIVAKRAYCLSQTSTIGKPAETSAARASKIREFMSDWMDEGRCMSGRDLADLATVG